MVKDFKDIMDIVCNELIINDFAEILKNEDTEDLFRIINEMQKSDNIKALLEAVKEKISIFRGCCPCCGSENSRKIEMSNGQLGFSKQTWIEIICENCGNKF